MNINVVQHADHRCLELVGRFDAHETAAFRAQIELLNEEAVEVVKINLSQVVFADSSALAELVRAMRATGDRGGKFILVDPSDPMQIILEMTALNTAFLIESTTQTPAS